MQYASVTILVTFVVLDLTELWVRWASAVRCKEKGLTRVAADGFRAPGVVVVHTSDGAIAGKSSSD